MADEILDSLTEQEYAQLIQQRKYKSRKKTQSEQNEQRGS